MDKTHFERPFVGGSVAAKIVNPDLAAERRGLFDKEEMIRQFLDEEILELIKLYADDLIKHPELRWD